VRTVRAVIQVFQAILACRDTQDTLVSTGLQAFQAILERKERLVTAV
jgi:hypothetical protein